MIIEVKPTVDYRVRTLCAMPYRGHSRGCPNLNRRRTCPPDAGLFDVAFDLSQPVYAVVVAFSLEQHVETMRERHPSWSERQLRCCLYWQGSVRKALRAEAKRFLTEHPYYRLTMCPEAMGVNVTDTMRNAGIILEWPPERIVLQIAMAGILASDDQVSSGTPPC